MDEHSDAADHGDRARRCPQQQSRPTRRHPAPHLRTLEAAGLAQSRGTARLGLWRFRDAALCDVLQRSTTVLHRAATRARGVRYRGDLSVSGDRLASGGSELGLREIALPEVIRNFVECALLPFLGLCKPEHPALKIERGALTAQKFLTANFHQPLHALTLLSCEANPLRISLAERRV